MGSVSKALSLPEATLNFSLIFFITGPYLSGQQVGFETSI